MEATKDKSEFRVNVENVGEVVLNCSRYDSYKPIHVMIKVPNLTCLKYKKAMVEVAKKDENGLIIKVEEHFNRAVNYGTSEKKAWVAYNYYAESKDDNTGPKFSVTSLVPGAVVSAKAHIRMKTHPVYGKSIIIDFFVHLDSKPAGKLHRIIEGTPKPVGIMKMKIPGTEKYICAVPVE
jgi:hypothetical protein